MKGSYVLLITLPEEQEIAINGRQRWFLHRGHYAYIGSAMGGLKPRLRRHLNSRKRLHWHIDYLLQKASINDIIICQSDDRVECTIARTLNSRFDSIPGFGSSDCRCHSHLFFAACEMKSTVLTSLKLLGRRIDTFTPSLLERQWNHTQQRSTKLPQNHPLPIEVAIQVGFRDKEARYD